MKVNNNDNPIKKLKGTQGEALFIDTGKVYHKGGFVSEKNNYRILIQSVYTPIFSLNNWNNNNNKIFRYIQQKLTTLRTKLRKNYIKKTYITIIIFLIYISKLTRQSNHHLLVY